MSTQIQYVYKNITVHIYIYLFDLYILLFLYIDNMVFFTSKFICKASHESNPEWGNDTSTWALLWSISGWGWIQHRPTTSQKIDGERGGKLSWNLWKIWRCFGPNCCIVFFWDIFWKQGIIIFWSKSQFFKSASHGPKIWHAASSHREETTISKHGLAARKTCASGNRVIWSRDLRRKKNLDEKSQQKNLELITTWSFSMILQKTPRWEDNYVALRGLLLFQAWKSWWSMNAEWRCTSTARPITALWGFEWHVHQHWMEMDCMPSRVSMFTLTRTWRISSPSQHLCCIWNGFGCDVVFREGLWLLSRQVCLKDS